MRKGTAWPTNQDATVQPRPAARETDGERRPSSVTIACCNEPVLGAGGVAGTVTWHVTAAGTSPVSASAKAPALGSKWAYAWGREYRCNRWSAWVSGIY